MNLPVAGLSSISSRQSPRCKDKASPSRASRKTSTPQAPLANWCFISSGPWLNLNAASSASARVPACRRPGREEEKADGQNLTPRYQRSLWPKSSIMIRQTRFLRFVEPCISLGQRCTGISTLAGGMWRNHSALRCVNRRFTMLKHLACCMRLCVVRTCEGLGGALPPRLQPTDLSRPCVH